MELKQAFWPFVYIGWPVLKLIGRILIKIIRKLAARMM
jgi:hypothetical protein